jgi:hypothetical protein
MIKPIHARQIALASSVVASLLVSCSHGHATRRSARPPQVVEGQPRAHPTLDREGEREDGELEPAQELILREEELETIRSAPYDHVAPGAFANAVAQREALRKSNDANVPGTSGTWSPIGQGPLILDGAEYGSVNGYGWVHLAGRIDSLKFDEESGRLFASKGTGGVWMSVDFGDNWTSVGDTLPSQIVGAVGWTSANGGTLLAIGGEPLVGGGGAFAGIGAFYTNDLGQIWKKATGVPDGALGMSIEVDPSDPMKVYAATSLGLFRSTDGGRTYSNVNLPTGTCAGVPGTGTCFFANIVTDVEIVAPGGVGTSTPPGTVVAAVGWIRGAYKNPDGSIQSPRNGLYRSPTGAPGTFVKVEPTTGTFTQQERIGRVEFGKTSGPAQDHDYLYAIVQDAQALNGQLDLLDLPVPDPRESVTGGTVFNGIYVSSDFGLTWTLMADDNVIAKNPATGSALVGLNGATGYEPGVQSWYNMWIAADPTRQTAQGVPTRLAFGLEEVWQNEVTSAPMIGPATFKVIGRYANACIGLLLGPACPTFREPSDSAGTTTHPDQHDGLWIPRADGGVYLAVGNDGGFFRADAAGELDNGKWGAGNQDGFVTLLPYDAAMANDGTVWAGLQDNGQMKITPDGKKYMVYGGDGGITDVDPFDSNVAYEEYVFGAMKVTTDGGRSWRGMDPGLTGARFITPFKMDSAKATHLVVGGNEIMETIYGPETNGPDATGACTINCWQKVFDLGTRNHPGDPLAAPPTIDAASDPLLTTSAIDTYGDVTYAGWCGPCSIRNAFMGFKSGIATNVGGLLPARKMTGDGWHIAAANGLPNRFITSVTVDPRNVRTVYVTLGGYSAPWYPPGSNGDTNNNVGEGHLFKSTDGGENFSDISGNLPDVPATAFVLRGGQLIVGTDLGIFASDAKGGRKFAPLLGLPVVPISNVTLKPNDPDLLVAATYGRGVWSYRFTDSLKKPPIATGPSGCVNPNEAPPAAFGTSVLAGPYNFEANENGWTAGSTNPTFAMWRRLPAGNLSTFGFAAAPYNNSYPLTDTTSTMLASPSILQTGGWLSVEFAGKRDLEPGFDYLIPEWSCDGGASWTPIPYRWDAAAGAWGASPMTGQNLGYPLYDVEKLAFKAPAGPIRVRLRVTADQLQGSPAYLGAWVDDIVIKR